MFRSLLLSLASIGIFVSSGSDSSAQNKNNPQERKDDRKVASAREDVNEIEKRLQGNMKELKAADAELRKLHDKIVDAKKEVDAVRKKTEQDVAYKLRINETIEEQKKAVAAYEEASKPLVAAMRTNPKYSALAQRVDAAEKALKDLNARTDVDDTTRQHLQSQSSKDLADWRYNVKSYLDSAPELRTQRDKLLAVQAKLADSRHQLKLQVDAHADVRNAEKKYDKAKQDEEKAKTAFASKRQKVLSDQSKLVAERGQLAKAMAQDKQNNNNNNNKNKNNNKSKKR